MRESLINISSAVNGRSRRRTLTCAITAERRAPNSPDSPPKKTCILSCRINSKCFAGS